MGKALCSLLGALVLLATASVSDAKIFVNISDGTTTLDARAATAVPFIKGGLILSKTSTAPTGTTDVTDRHNILQCTMRPCRVFFPSGNTVSAQPGDTFRIEDVSSTSPARIEKFDSGASADRVSMKGVKFTALVAGKVLTVIYGTTTGDLRPLTSTQAASYSVSAAFSGFIRTSAGLRASACKTGTLSTDMDEATEACVRLSIALNGTTADGQGSSASTTVAVPCNNLFPAVNPCGTGGVWTAANGTFTAVNDGKSISCPSACSPAQVGTLTARFNAINDVLQLTASTHGTIANVPDQNGGAEEGALALAGEVPLNRWVTTSAATERCRTQWKAPAISETRSVNNSSTIPLSTEYYCGFLVQAPPDGIPLISLADTALLPGAASTRYEASRVTFLPEPGPGQLQFKGINTLSVAYDVIVQTNDTNPTDGRLKDFEYKDCFNGSVHLAIQLIDSKGVGLGSLFVYLGSTNNFKTGCDGVEAIVGGDIKNNPDARVDASQLLGGLAVPCCRKFSDLQKGQIGNARVRKLSFVVSRPISPASDPAENYKVVFKDANLNGITAVSSLRVVAGETRVTEGLSTNGVSFVITKLTGTNRGVKKVIPSSGITINGGKFTASVNVNDIDPESGAQYGISLCPNGTEENDPLLPPNTVLGICIADQAIMTLL
jgi:hypothetical protein